MRHGACFAFSADSCSFTDLSAAAQDQYNIPRNLPDAPDYNKVTLKAAGQTGTLEGYWPNARFTDHQMQVRSAGPMYEVRLDSELVRRTYVAPNDLNFASPAHDLHRAVSRADVEAVEQLLQDDVDVNQKVMVIGRGEQAALHVAAQEGHDHLLKTLLKAGADIDALDHNENTAYMLACSLDRADCL